MTPVAIVGGSVQHFVVPANCWVYEGAIVTLSDLEVTMLLTVYARTSKDRGSRWVRFYFDA